MLHVGAFFLTRTQGAFAFWMSSEAANFWLFVASVTVMCLAVDWAFKGFKRNLFPEPFHVIQNSMLASSSKAIGFLKEFAVTVEYSGTGLASREGSAMPLTSEGTSTRL